MKVYGLITDNGDGSNGLEFFIDPLVVDKLLEDENYLERYYGNEGAPAIILTLPDDTVLSDIGIRLYDYEYNYEV